MALFRDRADAGRRLARIIAERIQVQDALVLALPRGGVPVGYEIARALHLPLEVCVVQKLGVPGHEELAMGALARGGQRVINDDVVTALHITPSAVQRVAEQASRALARREQIFRDGRPHPILHDKQVILVDDGLATGASMRVAIYAVRAEQPRQLIGAVPTGAADVCEALRTLVDEFICVTTPQPFLGVGLWYEDFAQLTDEDVQRLLRQARAGSLAAP